MQKGSILAAGLLFLLQFFFACNREGDPTGNTSGSGTLKIYLTDAPAAMFDSVNIVFSEVSAHIDSQWISVRGDTIKVNLLELSNGKTLEFGSADVPAGKYTQIRIIIDDAYLVLDGQRHNLEVPSGAKTGLKLGPQFTVANGSTYEMVVDFDANRSIVVTGPPHNPGYKLKPRLRVVTLAVSGSISGEVTNPQHLPVAYALQGADTVSSTTVEPDRGFFMLSFLPAGTYAVSIEDTLGRSVLREGVAVTAGSDNSLGQITLQ